MTTQTQTGEEIRQEEWGIDVVITASQKAVGVPPGLALFVVSQKAMTAWRERKTPVMNYYGDWSNWLPIMEAYEARRPSYFGTPAVNLVCALEVSLGQILAEGMDARFARHQKLAKAFQAAIGALGMKQVPTDPKHAASTLTAPRFPEGVTGPDLLPKVVAAGVILAGGLHPKMSAEYFRIGHMGDHSPEDICELLGWIDGIVAEG